MERSAFSSDRRDASREEPELSQYRAISPWAVATLMAGLASGLALVGPLLWWVPLLVIPLAAMAFRQLRHGDPPYVGHTATVLGMCLAALFSGWGISQRVTRESLAAVESRQLVDGWIKLVQAGKLHEAHQIQSSEGRRVAAGTDLESFYKAQPEAGKEFEEFSKAPLLVTLSDKSQGVALEYSGDLRHVADGSGDTFVLRYEVTRGTIPGCHGSVWISARRERDAASGVSGWQVTTTSLTDPNG